MRTKKPLGSDSIRIHQGFLGRTVGMDREAETSVGRRGSVNPSSDDKADSRKRKGVLGISSSLSMTTTHQHTRDDKKRADNHNDKRALRGCRGAAFQALESS